MIATNTIAQGDTRDVGIDAITKEGGAIFNARSSMTWPGVAAVVVSIVHIYKGIFVGNKYLDEKVVSVISAFLDNSGTFGKPYPLINNAGKSYQGSIVLGLGFVLTSKEAQDLININQKNKDVLFPYLVGEDLNNRYDQSASRWVINFFDWPLEKAEEYPDCLEIIRKKVKPERTRLLPNGKFALRNPLPQKWWIYAEKRPALYGTISSLEKVLVVTLVSRTVGFSFVPTGWVYAHRLAVFPLQEYGYFGILQSSFHYFWAWKYSSTMKSDLNYSPSDCFETFPLPVEINGLNVISETYYETRRQIMLIRQEGLTPTYNRFNNPKEQSSDIVQLRGLHTQMDYAVAAAYDWSDLNLEHGFHETAQGIRFTISEEARRDVLARLLRLNNERFDDEVRQGLHEKKKEKTVRKKSKSEKDGPKQFGLF